MNLVSVPRLGIVVPPENPTAEPEFRELLGGGLSGYTTRFPITPGRGLREMLETYNEVLPTVLTGFGRMRLDAAVVSCSASHYLLSPDGDRKFCDMLGDRVGFPVASSTRATLAACEVTGTTRLTLVSPYEPWLTDLSRAYWEQAGLTVDRVVRVPAGDHFDPYAVTTGQILDQLGRHDLRGDSAVLFTGTGMRTLASLDKLSKDLDQVLLSSNLASAWWALRATGATPGTHPLLKRLADQEGAARRDRIGRADLSRDRSGSRPPAL